MSEKETEEIIEEKLTPKDFTHLGIYMTKWIGVEPNYFVAHIAGKEDAGQVVLFSTLSDYMLNRHALYWLDDRGELRGVRTKYKMFEPTRFIFTGQTITNEIGHIVPIA
jgi:hypothetical protein